MTRNNTKISFEKLSMRKRRGVAEVISTLLLVVITVVGAVILTSFIDESFVSGSQAVVSGTDTTIKTIRLLAYDTRNGEALMEPEYFLNNTNTVIADKLCRQSCLADTAPSNGGSNFLIFQIENRSIRSIFINNVILGGISHTWDKDTSNTSLDFGAPDSSLGNYPSDGQFSVLSTDPLDLIQGDNEIAGGQTVNLLLKLDTTNNDIELSKTMRVQVNIGDMSLANFLIETGDTR